jgi:predicted RNase H-like HicB family nuclease
MDRQDIETVTQNVTLQHDEETDQWIARYHAIGPRVSSVGEDREEALANLTDAVVSYLDWHSE